jgi:hypothetical protein
MGGRTRQRVSAASWVFGLRVAAAVALLSFGAVPSVLADEPILPASIQAVLLAKSAGYDRTLLDAGGRVAVGLLAKTEPDSAKLAAQVRVELAAISAIADRPHTEIPLPWSDAQALARVCEEQKIAILYVASGFDAEIPAIVSALHAIPILTVAADPKYVPRGIVLGFDLVSGRPKLLVNLTQARKQGIDLSSQLLKLAKVLE